jgi:hypothetical protein
MVNARAVRCLMKAAATSALQEAPALKAGPADRAKAITHATAQRCIKSSQRAPAALCRRTITAATADGSPRRVNVS